jgi:hypothetical protein
MEGDKKITIGLYNDLGDVVQTVSLDDLVATGDWYDIQLRNFGCLGSVEYELVVPNEKQIAEKIRLGQLELQKSQ